MTTAAHTPRRPLGRFVVAFAAVVAVMVFVLAPRASSSPDGLEKVAADTGIDGAEGRHALAGGPLADYRTAGVDDAGLATGIAGAAGVVVTLGAATLLARGLARRRRPVTGS
jgi:hypothetical protein